MSTQMATRSYPIFRIACILLILSGCASVDTQSSGCDNFVRPLVLTPPKNLNDHSDEESHCTIDERIKTMTCEYEMEVITLPGMKESEPAERTIYYQVPVPKTERPADGYPVVIIFHGWGFPANNNWAGNTNNPYGGWWQSMTTKVLLDNGYAVITPDAYKHGGTFWDTITPSSKDNLRLLWDTNISPYKDNEDKWKTSPDHHLMTVLFKKIEEGDFCKMDSDCLDPESLYAIGISSGGYMTSRMAVSYSDHNFRALAINSAAYATCLGPLCEQPVQLPDNHPPTLFLHGGQDTTVPIETMNEYHGALDDKGIDTRSVCDPNAEHEWLNRAPEEILHWFNTHSKSE